MVKTVQHTSGEELHGLTWNTAWYTKAIAHSLNEFGQWSIAIPQGSGFVNKWRSRAYNAARKVGFTVRATVDTVYPARPGSNYWLLTVRVVDYSIR